MKRKILSVLLISMVFFALNIASANACTNFLITKGASANGSTYITYAADSHLLYGELYYWPAADYPDGSWLDVYEWDTGKYLGKIKQVAHTYSVVGNMNEHQVAIGETTFGGRHELEDPDAIIDYGSLMYIALQRSKTAREAIKVMTDLVAEYGYYSSGESFSISDPNEVWIMEMISKGKGNKGAVWVARRIPDGYISGHANQSRIRNFPLDDPENTLYAKDIISFAREKGYFTDKKDKNFSFVDAYAPPDYGGLRFCEARVWAGFRKVNSSMDKYEDFAIGDNPNNPMPLWIKPDKKITTQDVMALMRDHFEGTVLDMTKDVGAGPYANPYRWRPLTWEVDSVEYCNERAISTQQTGFSFVAESRNTAANPIGGIFWFGVDDASSTVYVPIYSSTKKIPETFAVGNGSLMDFSYSAFWVFNQVSNFAYTRYNAIHPEIEKKQKELEDKYIALQPAIDIAANELYKKDKNLAIDFISDYSVNQANNMVKEWQNLYAYLFTKYMDGNIKTRVAVPENYKYVTPELNQPGYSNDWYKMIIKQKAEHFKVKKLPGELEHH
ncbi:MAG: C69 family dipeptidase [Bacteroidales bacterium]|nr:C69 family dipeptidase [Bacteroidales bacterium]